MKFDIITQQGYSQKPNIFGNVVPLFILGEIDGFNPEKLEKMRRKCHKTIYRGEFGDNWDDKNNNFRILDEEKSDYYHEMKEIETRSYEDKLRFRTFINYEPDSGKLKKKIRQNTIYLNDDEDLTTDLVYNGGFFRCDINMKDIDTKFSKEETNLIELHLHNEADNILKSILENKEELNSQIMKNIILIK